MRLQALKARPRRSRLPPDPGERQIPAVAANVLDRSFEAPIPNRKQFQKLMSDHGVVGSMSRSGNV